MMESPTETLEPKTGGWAYMSSLSRTGLDDIKMKSDLEALSHPVEIEPELEPEAPQESQFRKPIGQFTLARRRLFALIWLNMVLRYRQRLVTILEVFVPGIVMLIFVLSVSYNFNWELSGKAQIELTKDAQDSNYTRGTDTTLLRRYFTRNEFISHKHGGTKSGEGRIIFTPVNNFTLAMITKITANLNITNLGRGVGTEIEVVEYCKGVFRMKTSTTDPAPIGLIFMLEEKMGHNGTYDYEDYFNFAVSYKIRTFLPEVANTKELFPYHRALKKEQNLSPYVGSGFLGLQNAIDFAYMELIVEEQERNSHPNFLQNKDILQQTLRKCRYAMFPYTVFLDIKARHSIWFLLIFSIVLGNFFSTYFKTKQIIKHRESGILENLKLHGMTTSINWMSMLLQDTVSRACQAGILTWILMSTLSNVVFLKYENPMLVWLILYLYGFAQTTFLFATTMLFSREAFGSVMSCCISFLTFVIPMSLYNIGFHWGKTFNALSCFLLPNWCLANAIFNILKFESYDTGASLSFFSVLRFADERRLITPIGVCIILFLFTMVAYITLVVYVDNISKKKLTPKKPYSYCFKGNPKPNLENQEEDDEFVKPVVYEEDSSKVSIKCRNITHIYNAITHALDDVNMNIYEGEVTLILGHTGSGKSSLLQCIGGLLQPTTGYVRLQRMPSSASIDTIRQHVGYCPQEHLFYSNLTVQEHIRLCCLLHGHDFKVTKRQVMALILRLNLYNLKNMSAESLSEAEKRKLSIAMALANNPKILILDQPTSRFNSSEVQDFWNSLRSLKKGRCIIATVNTMEEGDLYADRIAVLAKGRLLAFCSPRFLKQTLNVGSYVKLQLPEIGEVDIPGVISTINQFIGKNKPPAAQVQMKAFEHYEGHLYVSIPAKTQLSKILRALEDGQNVLGFSKVSIIHMSLAGVLQELTRQVGIEQDNIGVFISENPLNPYEKLRLPVEIPTFPPHLKKDPNYLTTVFALFIKHILFFGQKHKFMWIEYSYPFIMAFCLTYFSESFIWHHPAEHPLLLTVNTYPVPRIPVYLDMNSDIMDVEEQGLLSILGGQSERLVLFGDERHDTEKFKVLMNPVRTSMTDYRAQVVLALSTGMTNTAYYASNALHSAPAVHNFLTNLFLFIFTDDNRRLTQPYRLVAYNHPILPFDQPGGTVAESTNAAVAVMFSTILALVSASKIVLPFLERMTGFQKMQMINGVTPLQYWGVTYIFDALINIVISLLLIGTIYFADVMSQRIFSGFESKLTLFYIILVYLSCSSLPYTYFLSTRMRSQYSGYGQHIIIHIVIGVLPQIVIYNNLHNISYVARGVVEGIFSLSPPYTVTGALIKYVQLVVEGSYCKTMPIETQELCEIYDSLPRGQTLDLITSDPFFKSCCVKYCKAAGTCYKKLPFFTPHAWEIPPNLFTYLRIMLYQGIFYMLLLLILEYNLLSTLFSFVKKTFTEEYESVKHHLLRELVADTATEAGFRQEVERIEEIADSGVNDVEDLIYARNITKWYGKKEVLSHVYFGLTPGSVLGIMGLMNSGRSVLVNVITGNVLPSTGYCVIRPGLRLDSSRKTYLRKVGYCPEKDAMLPFLTGFQMMQLLGRIRYLPAAYLDIHCKKWLQLFRFSHEEMSTVTENYEPGLKRRLSCAMALLGNCEVVVFDDATFDLDVIGHLNFWSIIQLVRLTGQCVIFTSMSAQECVENSTKVLLLDNGKVMAVGSPSSVIELYATGWTVIVRFRADISSKVSKEVIEDKRLRIRAYIEDMYSPCELKGANDDLLIYHVLEKTKALSEMYVIMENIHKEMKEFISDYLIEESSLDDVMGYSGLISSGSLSLRLGSSSSKGEEEESDDLTMLSESESTAILRLSPKDQEKWVKLMKQNSNVQLKNNINDQIRGRKNRKNTLPLQGRQSLPSAPQNMDTLNFLQNRIGKENVIS